MPYFVYFIRTNNNLLYIGHTNNLNRRKLEHKYHHEGSKFLKDSKSNFEIVYFEKFGNRVEAMRREKQFKGWKRAKKEALIRGNLELLKKL